MKKIILSLALTALFSFAFVNNNYAQDEWTHGKKGIYSIGLGGTDGIAVGSGYHYVSPAGMSINASGEYKVYKFIGLGWQTGLDFFFNGGYYGYYGYGYGYTGGPQVAIGIPLIVKANVHILDAIGGISIANKLDVYGGLNFGGGPAILTSTYSGESRIYGFIQIGPTVGARYWFKDNVAVFGEFGWGATFANVGVTF